MSTSWYEYNDFFSKSILHKRWKCDQKKTDFVVLVYPFFKICFFNSIFGHLKYLVFRQRLSSHFVAAEDVRLISVFVVGFQLWLSKKSQKTVKNCEKTSTFNHANIFSSFDLSLCCTSTTWTIFRQECPENLFISIHSLSRSSQQHSWRALFVVPRWYVGPGDWFAKESKPVCVETKRLVCFGGVSGSGV